MTSNINKKLFSFVFIFFYIFGICFAEEPYYFYDLPVGFSETYYEETDYTHMYSNPKYDLVMISKIGKEDLSVKETISNYLDKLSATYDLEEFKWNNSNSAFSLFEMKIDNSTFEGAATCVELDNKEKLFTILYCPDSLFNDYFVFIFSTLNSLCINDEYYNKPGILITSLEKEFTHENIKINTKIKGINKQITIDNADIELSQTLIELEYKLLNYYRNDEKQIEAWQRYYRIIYKDNYGRIEPQIKEIIEELKKNAKKNKEEDIDLYIAQTLLSWVQNFNYVNSNTASESDFVSLCASLKGNSNDCDSRSMLICALLNYYGIKSVMLVSPEFSHAMVAINLDRPGQKFNYSGKEYLIGETTAHLTFGTIVKKFQDPSKWFVVSF